MIAYSAMLDVPRDLVRFVARLLAAERRSRGTRRQVRALTCWYQALFVLVWFRDRPDVARLGAGFGISQATAYRYLTEAVEVLAAQAPDLHEALDRALEDETPYLILDGKVFSSNRLREKTTSVKGRTIDRWYSGKAHEHGGNVQALMRPDGVPLWTSDVEPGSTHDIAAARTHVLGACYPLARRLPILADLGYDGAGHGVYVPFTQPADGRALGVDNRTYNTLLRRLRCLGERGFALLTCRWKTLQHITASPSRIGHIVKAALVLTHYEHKLIS